MSDWYQNTILIFVILLIALAIPYIQKIKFNNMFEITNIDKDL